MNNFKKYFILVLALIGFGLTVELAVIYYNANFNPYALSSFCSVNNVIDCDGIAKTIEAQCLGIPLAYWGMGLYLFVIMLTLVDSLKEIKFLKFLEVFKSPFVYISAITFIAFILGMVLASVSIFHLKKVCVLCFVTYFLNLFICLISNNQKNFFDNFKISFADFLTALKAKKYLITFVVLSVIATMFLAFTSVSYIFAPQVKVIKSVQYFANLKINPYKIMGNILGEENGTVTVHVYSDFVCPMCYATNIMIHKAAKEFKNVKFVHHNMPLDKECNLHIPIQIHPNACLMSRYALAAKNQGNYWGMSSELFEKKPKNEKEILKIAENLKLDVTKLRSEANSLELKKELQKEIDECFDSEIEGTPALIIDGKKYLGIKPYFELVEILKDAGAIKR